MKQIELTQGKVALVDDDDFDRINQHKWCANKIGSTFYAVRWEGKWPNRKRVFMHREIMNPLTDKEVHHKNNDGLDNRKANLEILACSEHVQRGQIRKNNTTGYIGVSWRKREQKRQAQITVNGKGHHLGTFATAEEAARAYDQAALKYFGSSATLNFPLEDYL